MDRRAHSPAPAIGYRKVVAKGVPLHVVQVDLSRPEVRLAIETARNGIGSREDWSAMIDRARPAAAITGTYFDVPSAIPVGSIIVAGKSVHRGLVGTAFTFAPTLGAKLVACRPGRQYDWSRFETVLRAGPRLLTAGQRTLWPGGEGFHDPAIFARKKRTAVALTRHGKLLLIGVEKPVLLRTLAQALQTLGVVDAMCLDGGSSTGLYHHGKTRLLPRRPLTNLLVVYDSAARYRERIDHLVPAGVKMVTAPVPPAS
jgi:Phosphodiester glycosidase